MDGERIRDTNGRERNPANSRELVLPEKVTY